MNIAKVTVLVAIIQIFGCAGTASNGATAASYEAQQLECVDKAKTREESQACRCDVKAKFGRPCAIDGGAP